MLQKNNIPIISIIVLSYNNYKYLYECLDSIFIQSYGAIELIISDDKSSFFDIEELNKYLVTHKSNNICSHRIEINSHNLGTVKNINSALKMTTGKWIKLIAADDKFSDPDALTKYVDVFQNNDVSIIVSKWSKYDELMVTRISDEPSKYYCDLIESKKSNKIFRELISYNFLGGVSSCFAKELLIKYNCFDENYILTEDWPFWLKIVHANEPIYLINSPLVKYRMGGISSKDASNIELRKLLRLDLVKMIDLQIIPLIGQESRFIQREAAYIKEKMLYFSGYSNIKKLLFILKYLDCCCYTVINLSKRRSWVSKYASKSAR